MWCCRWPKCNRIYRLFFEKTSSMPCLFCRNSKFSQIFCQLHFYIRSLIYLWKGGLYVLSKMPTDVISDIVSIASWTTPPNPWAGWKLSIGDLPYTLASQVMSVPILMNQHAFSATCYWWPILRSCVSTSAPRLQPERGTWPPRRTRLLRSTWTRFCNVFG